MQPILFNIGPFFIHAYGFAIAIAFLVGILLSIYYANRAGLKKEIILDIAVFVVIAGIVGARLLYVIGQWHHYKDNLISILMVQQGGLAFLGGFIFAVLAIAIYARIKKIPFLKLLDVLSPGAALGYAITRIGCFLNGCCFGVPTEVSWGLKFSIGSLAHAHYPGESVHPTQLYAFFSMLAVFLIIVYLWRQRKYDGQIFFWWLILYAFYRFVVEFFRYCPAELIWLGLRPGQIIALAMFGIGIAGLCLMHKRFQSSF